MSIPKGFKHSEETKKKIKAKSFLALNPEKRFSWKGKKLSSEHIKKLSLYKIGHNKGGSLPEETKVKIGNSLRGEKSHFWISDRSKLKRYEDRRNDSDYKSWRSQVYARDGWKCRIGNSDCEGHIEAHHILGWKEHPELRYDVNNGITLCHTHHPIKKSKVLEMSIYFKELININHE